MHKKGKYSTIVSRATCNILLSFMEKDSEYFVKNPKQIFIHLNQLIRQNSLISAHFGDNNESFITSILEVDPEKNLIKLDYGPKEYLNKQLLKSSKIEFRTEFAGIKVAFAGQNISKTRSNGQVVFSMPIPTSIFWMQRRQFYRVKVPLFHDSYCKITFKNEGEITEQTVQFKLLDISISGFSFFNDQMEFSNKLIPTSKFENCQLHLNGTNYENISFVVKNKYNAFPNKADKGQRAGCAFSQLTAACESNIQRYMQDIERELRSVVNSENQNKL